MEGGRERGVRVRTLQEPGVVALGVKKNPVAYKNQKFLGSNAHLPLTHAGTKTRDRVTKEAEKKQKATKRIHTHLERMHK